MESNYRRIFHDVDFAQIRGANFQRGSSKFSTIARIIYNGMSFTLKLNGSVKILGEFTRWLFDAPVDRWDMAYFAPLTLKETLDAVVEDTAGAPIKSWNDFFRFVCENIDMLNQVLHGTSSSIKIAYVDAPLPLVYGVSDFPTFMGYLRDNCADAGNLPSEMFIYGQTMTIPLDLYTAPPVRFTLKSPSQDYPLFAGSDVLNGNGYTCKYDTFDGAFALPCLKYTDGEITLIYSHEGTTDKDGLPVPQGWSQYTGGGYIDYDMVQNPIVVPYAEGLEYTFLTKAFCDIEYETALVRNYQINASPALNVLGENFSLSVDSGKMPFEAYCDGDLLQIVTMVNEMATNVHWYSAKAQTVELYEGFTADFDVGWYTLGASEEVIPYDFAERPLAFQLMTSDETAIPEAFATYKGEETAVKETLSGTFHFIFRA